MFDEKSWKKSEELQQECTRVDGVIGNVQACQILSESTAQDIDPTGKGKESAANKVRAVTVSRVLHVPTAHQTGLAVDAMAVLSHFGLEGLVDEFLAANGVHNLGNLLSLEPNIHTKFDNLNLWFEGTAEVRYWWTF